jgi:hypothetical protein
MRMGAARWLLSFQLLLGLTWQPVFAVGLKEDATLESLRTGSSKTDEAGQVATLIDETIDDVIAMPAPRDKIVLQMRLRILLDETRLLPSERRQQVAKYAVRIWRAAGFTENSSLLSVPDQQVLDRP